MENRNSQSRRSLTHLIASLAWIASVVSQCNAEGTAKEGSAMLKAGAHARNIDPESFPVWVSGGIVAGKGERVVDSLYARSLVIENESTLADSNKPVSSFVALCVVDSLGVPGWIV